MVVIGAGIVGLGHAVEALRRGYRVTVVEQAAGVRGASVQNFGHACVTAQAGQTLDLAHAARDRWLELARTIGFWARRSGTQVVARTQAELAVLEEFAAERGTEAVQVWDAAETQARIGVEVRGAVGGAHLPLDLQVDPREAAPAIAAWLESRGVSFRWRTAATAVEPGMVRTTRAEIPCDEVVVATHHDLDRLLPALAEGAGLLRCRLHMMRLRPQRPLPLTGPLLTGWSMTRYAGLAAQPSAATVARELASDDPEGVAWDVNLMLAPQRDGTVLAGDTHLRDVDAPPFQDEAGFAVLGRQLGEPFGRDDLDVVERWQGVYASAPGRELLLAEPDPGVHVTTLTTGIGMTTGLGIAARTFNLIEGRSAANPSQGVHT